MQSRGTLASAVAALAVVLCFSLTEAQTPRLPSVVCDAYRNVFIRLGCVDNQTPSCNRQYNRITRIFLGRPACRYLACDGYGSSLGTCGSSTTCATVDDRGMCNSGEVCCVEPLTTTVRTTTTSTTTTSRPRPTPRPRPTHKPDRLPKPKPKPRPRPYPYPKRYPYPYPRYPYPRRYPYPYPRRG